MKHFFGWEVVVWAGGVLTAFGDFLSVGVALYFLVLPSGTGTQFKFLRKVGNPCMGKSGSRLPLETFSCGPLVLLGPGRNCLLKFHKQYPNPVREMCFWERTQLRIPAYKSVRQHLRAYFWLLLGIFVRFSGR